MRGGLYYRYCARVRGDVGEGGVESPPDQLTRSAPNYRKGAIVETLDNCPLRLPAPPGAGCVRAPAMAPLGCRLGQRRSFRV